MMNKESHWEIHEQNNLRVTDLGDRSLTYLFDILCTCCPKSNESSSHFISSDRVVLPLV